MLLINVKFIIFTYFFHFVKAYVKNTRNIFVAVQNCAYKLLIGSAKLTDRSQPNPAKPSQFENDQLVGTLYIYHYYNNGIYNFGQQLFIYACFQE